MISSYLLLLLSSFFLNPSLPKIEHAIYIGVIQIIHLKNSPNAQLTIKVFADDLQDALRNENILYIPIADEAICNQKESLIEKYFQKHIIGKINKKPFLFRLTSCEKESDAYFIQFDMSCPTDWNSFEIAADFFMELFPSQTNILNLTEGEQKVFHRLTLSSATFETQFQ